MPLIPLVLQMPLFFVLFRAFRSGHFAVLVWTAVLTVAGTLAVWLLARRAGVGYYVVDDFGRPVRRASRRLDGIPRVLRHRPTVDKDDFLQRTSSAGR